ncbi:MAG: YbjQ family protein [Luteolibacter sp.]
MILDINIMLSSTTFEIPGYRVTSHIGMVRGIIVRSPTIAQGFVGGLKGIIGGKIGAYTQMCEQTRSQAYEDMERHAAELGANAIIGIRYDASSVEPRGAAVEVLCYGTAVVVVPA